jgi:hypothetical protein
MKTSILAGLLAVCAAPLGAQHATHASTAAGDTALARQLDAVRKATERYRDHKNAVADGYKLFGADGPLMGEHWYKPEQAKSPLDLGQPGTLQYANVDGKRELIGVAFGVYQRPDEPLPDGFSGTADHWHVHDIPKLARALVADRPVLLRAVNNRIESGEIGAGEGRSNLVMLHAWVWSDNPDGVFAQHNRVLPYLRAGFREDWAKSASEEAALGVSLLRDGCALEITRVDRLAKMTSSQKGKLSQACQKVLEDLQLVADKASSPEQLNQAAEEAWKKVAATRDRLLNAQQKERLNAVMEPMMPH